MPNEKSKFEVDPVDQVAPDDGRALWERPILRRLRANEANNSHSSSRGDGNQNKS